MERNKPNKNSYSIFGVWFFAQPKVVRMRMLETFEKEGIPAMTVRGWVHRRISPRGNSWKTVEKVTGQKAEVLFPY